MSNQMLLKLIPFGPDAPAPFNAIAIEIDPDSVPVHPIELPPPVPPGSNSFWVQTFVPVPPPGHWEWVLITVPPDPVPPRPHPEPPDLPDLPPAMGSDMPAKPPPPQGGWGYWPGIGWVYKPGPDEATPKEA